MFKRGGRDGLCHAPPPGGPPPPNGPPPLRQTPVAGLKKPDALTRCLDCGRQTSVNRWPVMHRLQIALDGHGFWAAHMRRTHSNGMSALQLQQNPQAWRDLQKPLGLLTNSSGAPMVDRIAKHWKGRQVTGRNCLSRKAINSSKRKRRQNPVTGLSKSSSATRNQPKPRRKHAKYSTTRWRFRLAMFRQSSPRSKPSVKPTLKRGGHAAHRRPQILSGLTGDRHDPRVVGKMARTSSCRGVIGLYRMRRWSLGHTRPSRKHVEPISTNP